MNKEKNIDIIIEAILKYDNKNNLSWTMVYKEVLKKLNIKNEINNQLLLASVVKKITNLGYDIIGEPFKLEKFK